MNNFKGEGIKNNPYVIETPKQFLGLLEEKNNPQDVYYKLSKHLDFKREELLLTKKGSFFNYILNGDSKHITNINYTLNLEKIENIPPSNTRLILKTITFSNKVEKLFISNFFVDLATPIEITNQIQIDLASFTNSVNSLVIKDSGYNLGTNIIKSGRIFFKGMDFSQATNINNLILDNHYNITTSPKIKDLGDLIVLIMGGLFQVGDLCMECSNVVVRNINLNVENLEEKVSLAPFRNLVYFINLPKTSSNIIIDVSNAKLSTLDRLIHSSRGSNNNSNLENFLVIVPKTLMGVENEDIITFTRDSNSSSIPSATRLYGAGDVSFEMRYGVKKSMSDIIAPNFIKSAGLDQNVWKYVENYHRPMIQFELDVSEFLRPHEEDKLLFQNNKQIYKPTELGMDYIGEDKVTKEMFEEHPCEDIKDIYSKDREFVVESERREVSESVVGKGVPYFKGLSNLKIDYDISQKVELYIKRESDEKILDASISKNEKLLAIGTQTLIEIWDLDTKTIIDTINTGSNNLSFNYDNSVLSYRVYPNSAKTIKFYSLTTKKNIDTYIHSGYYKNHLFNPYNNNCVIQLDQPTNMVIRDTNQQKTLLSKSFIEGEIVACVWGEDGKYIYHSENSYKGSGSIVKWEAINGRIVDSYIINNKKTRWTDFKLHGERHMVVGSANGLYLYNMVDDTTTTLHNNSSPFIIYNDSNYIYVRDVNKNKFIYDITLKKVMQLEKLIGHDNLIVTNIEKKILSTLDNNVYITNSPTKKRFLFIDANNNLYNDKNKPIEAPTTMREFMETVEQEGFYIDNNTIILSQNKNLQLVSNTDFMFGVKGDKDLRLTGTKDDDMKILISRDLEKEGVPIADIKAYSSPQLILANDNIKLEKVSNINLLTIHANDEKEKIRVLFSLDDGETWLSKSQNENILINIENFEDIVENALTIKEFNSIGSKWTEDVIKNGKIRFGYFLDIDDIEDISEIDKLEIEMDLYGHWESQYTKEQFEVQYTNETLTVRLFKDGTYKINYME